VRPSSAALGCAVHEGSLFANLDALADLIRAWADAPACRGVAGVRLTFGSKVAAAAMTATVVLVRGEHRFAFTTRTIAFCAMVAVGTAVLIRQARIAGRRTR